MSDHDFLISVASIATGLARLRICSSMVLHVDVLIMNAVLRESTRFSAVGVLSVLFIGRSLYLTFLNSICPLRLWAKAFWRLHLLTSICIIWLAFFFPFFMSLVASHADAGAGRSCPACRLRDVCADKSFPTSHLIRNNGFCAYSQFSQWLVWTLIERRFGDVPFKCKRKYCDGNMEEEIMALGWSWGVALSLYFGWCQHSFVSHLRGLLLEGACATLCWDAWVSGLPPAAELGKVFRPFESFYLL